MIDTLISSKTRIKLLLKFFLNDKNTGYLRGLESQFGESSNAIRLELNRLEDAGLLTSGFESNKKIFKANKLHPLFPDIKSMLFKYTGLTSIIDKVVESLGYLEAVYLTGDLAKGLYSETVEILVVGNVDQVFLKKLIGKLEGELDKKITKEVLNPLDFDLALMQGNYTNHLLLWSK